MDREERELFAALSHVRDRLEKQEQLFNLATDADEIEALIFEGKALSLRYSSLLRRARELGLRGVSGEEAGRKK